MPKLISIGELLIDFVPIQKGLKLKDVHSFERVAGGAPANVAACVSILGEESVLLTKVGEDAFGEFLIDAVKKAGVQTKYIKRSNLANTALAFVSLDEDGERDFSFYRNPSADMLLEASEIEKSIFNKGDILHFCSVDLIDAPVKYAHEKAIEYALENDMIISFDPNLRFPLWNDLEEYYQTIQEFIYKAHIVKISIDELEFITRINNKEDAISSLFKGNVQYVILTEGNKCASIISKDKEIEVTAFQVKAVDTTGAGDSFIGALLYQMLRDGITLDNIDAFMQEDYVKLAHAVSALVVTKLGAIPALPNLDEVNIFLSKFTIED